MYVCAYVFGGVCEGWRSLYQSSSIAVDCIFETVSHWLEPIGPWHLPMCLLLLLWLQVHATPCFHTVLGIEPRSLCFCSRHGTPASSPACFLVLNGTWRNLSFRLNGSSQLPLCVWGCFLDTTKHTHGQTPPAVCTTSSWANSGSNSTAMWRS